MSTDCPQPKKSAYLSQDRAERAMRVIWANSAGANRTLPCRAYHCRCGAWHLTSKPLMRRSDGAP